MKRPREDSNACCSEPDLVSCQKVDAHPEHLGVARLSFPDGTDADFKGHIDGDSSTFIYTDTNGTECSIFFNPQTNGMFGHIMTSEGRSFVLEYCGEEGHIYKEIHVQSYQEDDEMDQLIRDDNYKARRGLNKILLRGDIDRSTVVTYSVQIYYTKEVAEAHRNLKDVFKELIHETNQGYINSKVPLRIKLHCSKQVDIADGQSSYKSLKDLRRLNPSNKEILNSADVAVLIVNSFKQSNKCGLAGTFEIDSRETFSVVKMSCALGQYTFGHEIGHNVGLFHNIDNSRNRNNKYPYGHGYHISRGTLDSGFSTILAYPKKGHWFRVNYYSNPNVIYPKTGTRTGQSKTANNARVLIQRRFDLADIGDEMTTCVDNGKLFSALSISN